MARAKAIHQTEFPYFITARCVNKDWWHLPIEQVWEIFSEYLYFLHHAFDLRIHAFVLMNNHYHLIAKLSRPNLGEAMNYFQREVSKQISRNSGRINQVFGRPYFPCLLHSYYYNLNAYKYLYRNPVEAGLAGRCEEYRYSTLHGLLGQSQLLIPLELDTLLFIPELDVTHLDWLNTGKKDDFLEVERALSKSKFRFQKLECSGKVTRSDDFIF